mgnify:CR=1 FL=1
MMFILSVIFCALIAFYFYVKKCNNYWHERGVTTVKTNFLFGTSYDLLLGRGTFEDIYDRIYHAKPHEPYVGVYNLLKPVLFIRDPALIHQITVKDFSYFHERLKRSADAGGLFDKTVDKMEEEEWKTVLNKLLPIFSGSKMKRMYNLIQECADLLVEEHLR